MGTLSMAAWVEDSLIIDIFQLRYYYHMMKMQNDIAREIRARDFDTPEGGKASGKEPGPDVDDELGQLVNDPLSESWEDVSPLTKEIEGESCLRREPQRVEKESKIGAGSKMPR